MSAIHLNENNINDIIIDHNNDSNSENTITNSINSTLIPQQHGIIYLQPKDCAVSCEEFNKLRKTHSEESIYSSPSSLQLKSSSKVRRMSESIIASPASTSTLTTTASSSQSNSRKSSKEFKVKRGNKRGSSSSGSFNGVAILGQPIILTPENKQLLKKLSQGQLKTSPQIAILNNFDPPTPKSIKDNDLQDEDEDQPLLYYVNKNDKNRKVIKESELDSSEESEEDSEESEEDSEESEEDSEESEEDSEESETSDSEESEEDSESTFDDLDDTESEEEEDDDVDKEIIYPMRDGLKLEPESENITKEKESTEKKKPKKSKNKNIGKKEKVDKKLPIVKINQEKELEGEKEDEEEQQPLFNIKTKIDTKKTNRLSHVSFDDANNTVWNLPANKSPILGSPTSPIASPFGVNNGDPNSSYFIPEFSKVPGMPMDNNPSLWISTKAESNIPGPQVTSPLGANIPGPQITSPVMQTAQITSPRMQTAQITSPRMPTVQITSPRMPTAQITSPRMQAPQITSPINSNMQGPQHSNQLVPSSIQGPQVSKPLVGNIQAQVSKPLAANIQGQAPVPRLNQMDNNNSFWIPPTPTTTPSPTKTEANKLVVNIQGQQIPVSQLNQVYSFLPKNKNSATEKVKSFGNTQKLVSFNQLEMSTIPNSAKTKINHPKLEVTTQPKNATGLPSKSSQVRKARQNLEAAALKRRSWCNLNSDILNQVQIVPRINHQRNSSYPQQINLQGGQVPGQIPGQVPGLIITKPLVTLQKPPTSYQNLPGTSNFVNSNTNNGFTLPNPCLINVPYGAVINTNAHTTHNSINPHKKEENNKKEEKSDEKRELSPKELARQRIELWAEESKITACPVKENTGTEMETNKSHRSISNTAYNYLKNSSALNPNRKTRSAENMRHLEENANILAPLYNNNEMNDSDNESVSSYSSSSYSTSTSSSASSISDKDVSRKKKGKDKRRHHHRHNSHGSHSRDRHHDSHSRDRHSRDRRQENRDNRDRHDSRDNREHRHRHRHHHHDSYDHSHERRLQYRDDRERGRGRDYEYVQDPRMMTKYGKDSALRPRYYGNSSNNQRHLTPNVYNMGPIEVVNPEKAKKSRRRSFNGMPMPNPNLDQNIIPSTHANMNGYGVKYNSPRQNPKRTNIYQNSRIYM